MPPKDVKSAKKLYAKMKKEQKKEKGASENIGRDSATPEPEIDNTSEKPEQQSAAASPAPINAEEEHSKAAEDESAKPESTNEQDAEDNVETKTDNNEDVLEQDQKQAQKHGQNDNEDDLKSQDEGADVKPTESPADNQESTATEEVTENVTEQAIEEDVSHSDEPKKEESSPDVQKPAIQTVSSEQAPDVSSLQLGEDSGKNGPSEDTLRLQQENETLKQYVKKLESKVTRLENELNALRQSETMSLSPQLPEGNLNLAKNRNRAPSFVEADLYSEAEKISARNEQMRRWEGYQVDLRKWVTSKSFGKLVVI